MITRWLVLACLLAAVASCNRKGNERREVVEGPTPAQPPHDPRAEEKAVQLVKKMKGHLRRDLTRPGKPIVAVDLSGGSYYSDAHGLHFVPGSVTDADLQDLAGLTELTSLKLTGAKVTDAGLKHLAGFEKLAMLDLQNTLVTGAGFKDLAGLKHLEYVNLMGSKATDVGVQDLSGFRQLTTLLLGNTAVSDAGLMGLAQNHPKLRWLYLSQTNVSLNAVAALEKELPHCFINHDPASPYRAGEPKKLQVIPRPLTLSFFGVPTVARRWALKGTGVTELKASVHVAADGKATLLQDCKCRWQKPVVDADIHLSFLDEDGGAFGADRKHLLRIKLDGTEAETESGAVDPKQLVDMPEAMVGEAVYSLDGPQQNLLEPGKPVVMYYRLCGTLKLPTGTVAGLTEATRGGHKAIFVVLEWVK